jgi:hypothetical protein
MRRLTEIGSEALQGWHDRTDTGLQASLKLSLLAIVKSSSQRNSSDKGDS